MARSQAVGQAGVDQCDALAGSTGAWLALVGAMTKAPLGGE